MGPAQGAAHGAAECHRNSYEEDNSGYHDCTKARVSEGEMRDWREKVRLTHPHDLIFKTHPVVLGGYAVVHAEEAS